MGRYLSFGHAFFLRNHASTTTWTTRSFLIAPRIFVEPSTKPTLPYSYTWSERRLRVTTLPTTITTTTRLFHNPNGEFESASNAAEVTRRRRIRSLVKDIAKKVVPRSFTSSYAQPDAIAEVLKEATIRAIDEVMHRDPRVQSFKFTASDNDVSFSDHGQELEAVIERAFLPVERSLDQLERNLMEARASLQTAKNQAKEAVSVVQAAALAQVEGAASAVKKAEEVASRKAVAEIYATANQVDIESLAYEDVDFATSEMTPPFLGDDQCMVPGEAVVRVEKAPENSRRIFAGIDILASVDTVWQVLTDYENLQNVVPNLEVNQVIKTFEGKNASKIEIDVTKSELDQCKEMAGQLKGAILKQVGKVGVYNTKHRTKSIHSRALPSHSFSSLDRPLWRVSSFQPVRLWKSANGPRDCPTLLTFTMKCGKDDHVKIGLPTMPRSRCADIPFHAPLPFPDYRHEILPCKVSKTMTENFACIRVCGGYNLCPVVPPRMLVG